MACPPLLRLAPECASDSADISTWTVNIHTTPLRFHGYPHSPHPCIFLCGRTDLQSHLRAPSNAISMMRAAYFGGQVARAIPNRRGRTTPQALPFALDFSTTDDVLSQRESSSVSPRRILSRVGGRSARSMGCGSACDERVRRERETRNEVVFARPVTTTGAISPLNHSALAQSLGRKHTKSDAASAQSGARI